MKKSFLFKGVSILGAVLLLANAVLPGLQAFADYSDDTWEWMYVYDEASWDEAVANGGLAKYYAAYPDEDRWCAPNAYKNEWHYGQAADKELSGGVWPDTCTHAWSGVVNAAGSTLPWIVVNFKDEFKGKIKFSYEGLDDVYPWSKTGRTSSSFGIASLYQEFEEDNFSFLTGGENFNFDINKFNATLVAYRTLTIHYVYSNGNEAAEDFTGEMLEGEEYTQDSPAIANYTADVTTVSGTIADDVEVTVTYTPTNDENENGIADEEETIYTVSFDTNGGTPATIESQTNLLPGQKAEKPENPTKEGNVFAGWLDDESNEFDFDQAFENITGTATKTIALTAQWEAMTSTGGAMIELEDGTGTGMVVEADTPATSTDASAVQSSNSTATVQGEVELDVYNDADGDGAADGTDPISTKVNFTNPVLVRIPVSSGTSVKVKVKHNGESTFGIEGLTTNSGASCADGISDAAYDGSEIPANGYAEIWTCSASTFVAYTEEANQSSSSSSSTSGGGGGGSSKTSKTNDSAITGDNTTASDTNTDENNGENAEEQKPTMTEDEAVAKFGQEQIDAYKWALENGITTMKTVEDARLDEPLTRAELAKMMVVYIQKVVKKDPVITGDVTYKDVDESLGDLYGYIKLAYQYQIMGINADGTPIEFFNPYGIVSRGEYATVFSRVLFGDKFNKDGEDFYAKHLDALKTAGILTNTIPTIQEMRGWVMLMMYRSSQNGEAIEKVATTTEENADEAKTDESVKEETANEEATAVAEETKTETAEENTDEVKAEETTAETATGDTAEAPAAEETNDTSAESADATSGEANTGDVAEVGTGDVASN